MHTKLTVDQVARMIHEDEYGSFSFDGALALAERLEQLEQDLGTDMEIFTDLIRGEWTEGSSATEIMRDMHEDHYVFLLNELKDEVDESISDWDFNDLLEERCLEWLKEQHAVLEFDGGYVVDC